jgi:DNA-binding NarL/FixJ family response regulator
MDLRLHPDERTPEENKSSYSTAPEKRKFAGGRQLPDPLEIGTQRKRTLLVLDKRVLDRECITQSIKSREIYLEVLAFSSASEWRDEEDLHPPLGVVLLSIGGRKVSDPDILSELAKLAAEFGETPVIVLGDSDELEQILLALEKGARGYIPTTVGISVCLEAISLAMAGGTFVPASSVLSQRAVLGQHGQAPRPMANLFTQRQEEVARALRRGKANKIIAYELNMRESTVKVHIRNIMKKLQATNRTEVAYKIGEIIAGKSRP